MNTTNYSKEISEQENKLNSLLSPVDTLCIISTGTSKKKRLVAVEGSGSNMVGAKGFTLENTAVNMQYVGTCIYKYRQRAIEAYNELLNPEKDKDYSFSNYPEFLYAYKMVDNKKQYAVDISKEGNLGAKRNKSMFNDPAGMPVMCIIPRHVAKEVAAEFGDSAESFLKGNAESFLKACESMVANSIATETVSINQKIRYFRHLQKTGKIDCMESMVEFLQSEKK